MHNTLREEVIAIHSQAFCGILGLQWETKQDAFMEIQSKGRVMLNHHISVHVQTVISTTQERCRITCEERAGPAWGWAMLSRSGNGEVWRMNKCNWQTQDETGRGSSVCTDPVLGNKMINQEAAMQSTGSPELTKSHWGLSSQQGPDHTCPVSYW